jgi:hypothetical protein
MFIGPYKISLFADDTSNFMWWDLAPFMNGTGREFIAPTNNFAPSDVTYTNSLHITNIFFQCDYIQCDGPSFAIVMSQLPIPDTFALRTTAWTSASTLIPVESQGTVDLAIPIRRASLKCCYTLFSPARNPVTAPAGKFEWVNPNLGANTLIHINGKPYPQMGLDPTNRPNEVFKNFLLTIGTWNNDGPKSCIRPENFFVIDQILPASNGKQIRYNRWRNYHSTSTRLATTTGYVGTQTGAHTIRPAARPGLYSDITAPDDSLRSYSDVDWLRQGGPFGGVVSSASLGLRSAFLTPSQSFDPQVSSINVHLVADNGTVAANATTIAVLNSQTNLDPATDNSSLIQFEGTRCPLQGKFSANPTMACASNQFVLAYDFEHLAKVQYLSGVQSLTGSFFLKLTIERNLSVAYNATFICAFDQLVILHSALKTAFVRI